MPDLKIIQAEARDVMASSDTRLSVGRLGPWHCGTADLFVSAFRCNSRPEESMDLSRITSLPEKASTRGFAFTHVSHRPFSGEGGSCVGVLVNAVGPKASEPIEARWETRRDVAAGSHGVKLSVLGGSYNLGLVSPHS